MIKLESIRVRNFRAIKEATLKLGDAKIIGIFGPNGAGKTTFLAATLFALYGVKPPGASQNSLRRTGSKGESSVSVVFQHMGQMVEIIREIKAPNNRIVVNIYVDGVPQTVTSVGAADQWVKKRLGIDAVGFMTAFVVRQKELDQLVNAKPAERKAIIERLAGIDTINIALKAAREEENSGKKTLATLYGSQEEVDSTLQALDTSTRRLDKMTGERDDYQLKISTLDTKIGNIKKKAEAIKNDELEIQSLETKIELYTKQLTEAEADFDKLLPELNEPLSIEELRELFKDLSSQWDTSNKLLIEKKSEASIEEKAYNQAKADVNKFEAELKAFKTIPDETKDYKKLIGECEEQVNTNRELIAALKSSIEEINENLKSLAHAEQCPMCFQAISNPASLIKTLEDVVKDKSKQQADMEKAIVDLRAQITEYNGLFTAQQAYLTAKQSLENAKTALEGTVDPVVLKKEIEDLEEVIKKTNSEKDSVQERGQNLRSYLAQEESRKSLEDRIESLKKNIREAEDSMNKITEKIGGKAALKEVSQLTKMEEEVAALRLELTELLSQISALENRVGQEKQAYKSAKEAWERKRELLKKQETASLTTDVIEKFRTETIASLAPELSEFATSLISEMTNGDFTEVKLDEDFNPSVVDSSGRERPVSWLSGGEESAVALALRIAIAFLITGGQPELLWLDEVLTAQDADRRSTMLSMIRRLPINQIIMINHTQDAGDIVDKVVEIIPNLLEGSSIKESFNITEKDYTDNPNSADINY